MSDKNYTITKKLNLIVPKTVLFQEKFYDNYFFKFYEILIFYL